MNKWIDKWMNKRIKKMIINEWKERETKKKNKWMDE